MHRIGIDLGGTKFHVILSEREVTDVVDQERQPTNQREGYPSLIERIAGTVERLKLRSGVRRASVGVGIPGTMDRQYNVRFANALMLKGKNVKRDLETRLGQTVHVENDANCFALSEARYGAAKSKKTVLGVILGTGMGGGVIINGRPHSGANGIGGEWGHARFLEQGVKSWTGAVGEYESYLSGTGAKRNFEAEYGVALSFDAIVEEFRRGESRAVRFMEDYFRFFGRAMGNLINFFDPDAVVFGGGLSKVEEIYDLGRKATEPYVFGDTFETPFLQPEMGDFSGVFGAAALAEDYEKNA